MGDWSDNLQKGQIGPDAGKIASLLIDIWDGRADDMAAQCVEATDGANLEQELVLALADLKENVDDLIIDRMLSRSDPQFYELAHAMLAVVFGEREPDDNSLLSHQERAVIKKICTWDEIWKYDGDLTDILESHHLPVTIESLRNMLK